MTGWMPAASMYFRGPDDHLLEFIAMLPDERRPGAGVGRGRKPPSVAGGPREEAMPDSVLAEKTCTPCRGGVPPLTPEEAEGYRAQAPDWSLLDGAARIERIFRFRDFRAAFAFVARAAELAEAEGHHPDITFGWGYATVSLRTKKIKGLHENDFIMAAKLDRAVAA